ncbi:hypothetical protein KFE96_06885 [Kordiimonas sp. SCSIO 12603]|uniref:hypothetical protein n=1 Tax=Kordiimonas sp. SCSIO 12603 TaxID=2829596 RepID=UPI0021078E30|nr:hypothetical protein [Kordiimonas sp. SCSIO 12603]UTW60027.1 hypothetical protein KFE96_06885 [Kordiimonas sp. SCSIO 12603]
MRFMHAISLLFSISVFMWMQPLSAQEETTTKTEKIHADIIVEKQENHLLATYQLDRPTTSFQFQYHSNADIGALLQVQEADLIIANAVVKAINGKPFQSFSLVLKPDQTGIHLDHWSISQLKQGGILLNPRSVIGEQRKFTSTLCIKDEDNSCADMKAEAGYYDIFNGGIIDNFSARQGEPIYIGSGDFDVSGEGYRIMFAPSTSEWARDFLTNIISGTLKKFKDTGLWEPEVAINFFVHHYNQPTDKYYWTSIPQGGESMILNFRADNLDIENEYVREQMSLNIISNLSTTAAYNWFADFLDPEENWTYWASSLYWQGHFSKELLNQTNRLEEDFERSGTACFTELEALIEGKSNEQAYQCGLFSMLLLDDALAKAGLKLTVLDALRDARENFTYSASPKELITDYLKRQNGIPKQNLYLLEEFPEENPARYKTLLLETMARLGKSLASQAN